MWWVYALLSAFLAALTAIFAKVGVKNIDSDLATAIRTVVILIITWGIVALKTRGPDYFDLSRQTLLFLLLSGTMTGLSWLFYFKALQLSDVSKVAPVDKCSVALVILLSVVFLGEKPELKVIIGGILIPSGTLTLIW